MFLKNGVIQFLLFIFCSVGNFPRQVTSCTICLLSMPGVGLLSSALELNERFFLQKNYRSPLVLWDYVVVIVFF